MTAILQFLGEKLQTKPRRIGKTGKKNKYPQNPPRVHLISSFLSELSSELERGKPPLAGEKVLTTVIVLPDSPEFNQKITTPL
jgi:hypothetical protein